MPSQPIFTVAQVARYLRGLLDYDDVLSDVWVSGEVSNLARPQSGHLYFTLKDANTQIRCVFFRRGFSRVDFANGDAVVAHGRVSFYEAGGGLQLYVDQVQPAGIGLLQLQFEQLRARLEEEGLFDPARKRPLPRFPARVGVVTSPTGAALHDIINVLARRYPLVELVLAPTAVQGDDAPPRIVAALQALNALADIDVIVIARGGGSLEELWSFNDERVARAVFASRVPVVSGVGHETDVTIVDLVADLRAPTPSAAAEMVVPDQAELLTALSGYRRTMTAAMQNAISARWARLDLSRSRLRRGRPNVEARKQQIDDLTRDLRRVLDSYLAVQCERWRGACLQLDALSPLLTLMRGYAVVNRSSTGEMLTSVAQIAESDAVRVRLRDGYFLADVVERRETEVPSRASGQVAAATNWFIRQV
ncbi:MAG: exodeoxyribonuclease VII large subunit [Chloroflexota bacterium]|nr:MAG: exodeoxyribonuclease VII large subunit [Chloroflexota bacterium]